MEISHSPYLAANPISPTLRDSIYELQSHIGIVRRMPVSSLGGESKLDNNFRGQNFKVQPSTSSDLDDHAKIIMEQLNFSNRFLEQV